MGTALLALPVYAQVGTTVPDLTPLGIAAPFAKPSSLKRLRDYVGYQSIDHPDHPIEIPDDFYAMAQFITYWGYEFAGHGPSYVVKFRQTYDIQSLINSLIAEVNSLKDDGCSYYNVRNASLASLTSDKIIISASVSGKQRACDNILGTHDIGDIGGSATLTLEFSLINSGGPDDKFTGAFVAGTPSVAISADVTSVFGFDVNSVAGQIVGVLSRLAIAGAVFSVGPVAPYAFKSINAFDQRFWRNPSWSVNDVSFALEENGSTSSKKYRDFMADLAGFTWAIQPRFALDATLTGLEKNGNVPVLNIVFTTQIKKEWPFETVREGFQKQIDLLASFGKDDDHKTVGGSDSLWSISREYYRNPYYYGLLASANGLNRATQDHLKDGVVIKIPPLDKLTSQPNVHLMQLGETVWSVCKAKSTNINQCIKDIKALNPKVPLSDVRFLEPIRLPF